MAERKPLDARTLRSVARRMATVMRRDGDEMAYHDRARNMDAREYHRGKWVVAQHVRETCLDQARAIDSAAKGGRK